MAWLETCRHYKCRPATLLYSCITATTICKVGHGYELKGKKILSFMNVNLKREGNSSTFTLITLTELKQHQFQNHSCQTPLLRPES